MINTAILILCTNEKSFLEGNLRSLLKQSLKPKSIYLLDNNSSDGSVEYVQKNFPEVKIIKNPKNLGYATANNLGLRTAFHNGADLCLILNCDTVSDKNMFRGLINTYINRQKLQPKIGLLQPVILLADQPKKINTIGNAIHYLGYGYCKDYLKKYNPTEKDREIRSVSGAAMLISRQFFKDVGGFDESFYMYNEDQDLSWRGLLYGYHHYLSVKSKVYHYYNFRRHSLKMFHSEKNRLLMIVKNYAFKTILLISPILFLNELFVITYSFFGGWFFDKLKSYFYFLKLLKSLWGKRREIQKKRELTDRNLFFFFEKKLDFEAINNFAIKYVANPIYSFYYFLIKSFI